MLVPRKQEEILRPSADGLSANPTINAQNDKGANDCPLTPTPSPVGRGAKNHVILSKNSGDKEQSKHRGEGAQKDPSPEFLNSHLFIKKFFPQHCASLRYTSSHEKFKILKQVQNDIIN